MNIPNEKKKQEGTKVMPMSKILGVIDYNIDLMVNKLMEIFKNNRNCQREDLKILSYDNISTKNKRRNNYYLNCNRLSRFDYKRTMNYRNRNTGAMNMVKFQEYKRIIDLGRMEKNLLIDWEKYGQYFFTGRKQIIPDDLMNKNKTKMDEVEVISHLANMRCSEMNTIICYNNGDNKTDNGDKRVRFLDEPIENGDDVSKIHGPRRDMFKQKPENLEVYSGFIPNNNARNIHKARGNGNGGKSKNEKIIKKVNYYVHKI